MQPSAVHPQREWILIGIAECCAARGYEATTVEDVCAAAGVSRGAFEREFAGPDECLAAAMESAVEAARAALVGVRSPERPWGAVLRDGAAALLGAAAERPALAHLALLEAPHAGGRAGALTESGRAALLEFLERGRELTDIEVPESAARAALAGVETLLAGQVRAGRAARLEEATADAAYMLAVPFLGAAEATRLAAGAARRRHLRAVAYLLASVSSTSSALGGAAS
jgi:AcrR family transcriptional regulator